jgi:hypothetical protein
MRIFPVLRDDGIAIAFEIEHIYASRRVISRLLTHADGVSEVKYRASFVASSDVRIDFKYLDRDYVVWEPFGDNSRYWIGPGNLEDGVADVEALADVFKRYQPPFYRSLLGNVLSLQLFGRTNGRI